MNIAILCYHRIGGSGIVAYEIGRAMAEERGHHVHFMGLEPPFRLKDNQSENMTFHRVAFKEYPVFDHQPYALALASQLSSLIRRCKIEVIHSHYAMPHAISALLARDIAGIPVRTVTTLHGTDITVVGQHPSMIEITRYAIEKSDVVTAVSKNLVEDSEKILGITPGKIVTAYNFINPKIFHTDLKPKECTAENGKLVIAHISNLRPVKRPLDVIRIFHGMLKRTALPLELHVVGEGPMQYDVENLVEELGIQKWVKFLGVRNDIGNVLACTDLMLLPSEKESFGLAALEAMACGVPVAASRVGGLPEVIEDGRSGILFEMGDVEEAAEKAIRAIQNPGLFQSLRVEAVKTATETFAMEKIIDQYEELYRS